MVNYTHGSKKGGMANFNKNMRPKPPLSHSWWGRVEERLKRVKQSNKVLRLPKTLIIQDNIFVLNVNIKEINNS